MALIGPAVEVGKSAIDALKGTPVCLALVILAIVTSYLAYADNKAERERLFIQSQDERSRYAAQNEKLLDRCLSAYETRDSRNEAEKEAWRKARRAIHETVPPALISPGEEKQ